MNLVRHGRSTTSELGLRGSGQITLCLQQKWHTTHNSVNISLNFVVKHALTDLDNMVDEMEYMRNAKNIQKPGSITGKC